MHQVGQFPISRHCFKGGITSLGGSGDPSESLVIQPPPASLSVKLNRILETPLSRRFAWRPSMLRAVAAVDTLAPVECCTHQSNGGSHVVSICYRSHVCPAPYFSFSCRD